jgi:hypothetical protein
MILFWICVPLMSIAACFAVGVVLVPSLLERRRRAASSLISGGMQVPHDGATRLAVDVDPHAAGSAHEIVEDWTERDPHLRTTGVIIERTPDDGQLLVTVPEEAPLRDRAVEKLVRGVEDNEAFSDVNEIPPSEDRQET